MIIEQRITMTKKSILGIGLLGTLMFLGMFVLVQINGCREDLFFFCRDANIWIIDISKLFVIVFLLSLITYRMTDQIFHSWIKFAYFWVPLTLITVALVPEYSNSLLPIEKGNVSFFMSLVFLVISLIIILTKHFSLRKGHSKS